MLTHHEERLTAGDPEQKPGRAEVPVVDPDVLGADRREDLVQQRPLLRMAVLAEDHVDDEHQTRVEHRQRLSRQGSRSDRAQFLDAVLSGSQMIPVEDLDAIARQQRRQGAAHRRDHRRQPFRGGADQCGRDAGLDVVEFVVDRFERDADGFGTGFIGGVDGGADAADHHAHQVNDRGEEERARILPIRRILEQFIHETRREGILQEAPNHDRDRAILDESLENVVEKHEGRLHAQWVTPWKATA